MMVPTEGFRPAPRHSGSYGMKKHILSGKSYFKSKLDKTLEIFRRYSKIFPNGLSPYYRILGQYLWSQRRDEAARQAIAQSEAYAEQYAMTYEAALAQAWRGGCTPRKNAATSQVARRTSA